MLKNKKAHRYQINARSGATAIEAGFGIVHADTIVATITDELTVVPSAFRLRLRVGSKETSGPLADLKLKSGKYECSFQILNNGQVLADKKATLLLIEPNRICRRFGARYGSLEYGLPVVVGKDISASWKSLWKTNAFTDVVVDFGRPYKFIFWRGMSYAPTWVMNNVMTSLFFAETVHPGEFRDCCEMMSDRECRYSHVRIIHSSEARAVIHWRCALADTAYNICHNQWADEVFYIYPDGVAVRNVTIYIDRKDPLAWQTLTKTSQRVPRHMIEGGPHGFSNMEFITVNPPGSTSEENTPLKALTVLDSEKFSQSFKWPRPPKGYILDLPPLKDYIFRMNYHHRPGVFIASPPERLKVSLAANEGVRYEAGTLVQNDRWERVPKLPTNFTDFIHWPITRGYGTTSLTDPAHYQDRPTHTFLGYAINAPVEIRGDGAVTWSWFCGMAPEDEGLLRSRAESWLHPVKITGSYYDARQGAYVVNKPVSLVSLEVEATKPVIRPSFILPGWSNTNVSVRINGIPMDGVFKGVEHSLEGTRLIITFPQDLTPGSKILFSAD